jgi:hypothetical protein
MKLFFYLLNLFCVLFFSLILPLHGAKLYTKLYEILIFLSSFFPRLLFTEIKRQSFSSAVVVEVVGPAVMVEGGGGELLKN